MAQNSLIIIGFTIIAVVIPLVVIIIRRIIPSLPVRIRRTRSTIAVSPEIAAIVAELTKALPNDIVLPDDTKTFDQLMNYHWAQQESEVQPACILRPRTAQDVAVAVRVLKHHHDEITKQSKGKKVPNLFAIRAGSHSPVSGAASIVGGVLIDLSLFKEVTPSEDGTSVVVGAGCKWGDVSRTLEKNGLAVAGGRNPAVGVAGLTLGGGLSFHSPRFGLVCSNVISYEVVTASGDVVVASETQNSDLWRALKGGSNNFGIVTRFTFRSFPGGTVWSGFIFVPSFQANKTLAAFHEFVGRANPDDPRTKYDNHAAGPITCFTYIHAVRMQIISINLAYTKPFEFKKKWPACWESSGFRSLWTFWRTFKLQTLTDATDENNILNPPGRRQGWGTTTIKNNLTALKATHTCYEEAISSLQRANVPGLAWTLVLQPVLPDWVRKGYPNPMGLENLEAPLVNVSFAVNWMDAKYDDVVNSITRETIIKIEDAAKASNAWHPWKYLNYCNGWQKPFLSYGKDNVEFLRETSRRYDPEGVFQTGCAGGFKLDMMESIKQ